DGIGQAASYDVPTLRKGLRIVIAETGYKKHESNITSDSLKPAKQNSYYVQLDRDWSEIEKAIAELEGRVAAWNNDARSITTKAQAANLLIAKLASAKARAEALLQEVKKAADPITAGASCDEAR